MRRIACGALLLALAGCAAPPLSLYTLAPGTMDPAPAMTAQARVIAVSRVSLPDALDTADILVRDGAILKRSSKGRWAERLSTGITDLITAQLGARMPDALVTDQPQPAPVTARLSINISQLDVTSSGSVSLTADWTIVPADPRSPIRRDRAYIVEHGDTTNDAGTVKLVRQAIKALAERIVLPDA